MCKSLCGELKQAAAAGGRIGTFMKEVVLPAPPAAVLPGKLQVIEGPLVLVASRPMAGGVALAQSFDRRFVLARGVVEHVVGNPPDADSIGLALLDDDEVRG